MTNFSVADTFHALKSQFRSALRKVTTGRGVPGNNTSQ